MVGRSRHGTRGWCQRSLARSPASISMRSFLTTSDQCSLIAITYLSIPAAEQVIVADLIRRRAREEQIEECSIAPMPPFRVTQGNAESITAPYSSLLGVLLDRQVRPAGVIAKRADI